MPVSIGLKGMGTKQTTTGAQRDQGGQPEQQGVGAERGDQLLAHQLAGIRQGLEQAVGPDLIGPRPPLDEPGHFPLRIKKDNAVDPQEGHDGRERGEHVPQGVGQQFRELCRHRSISGITRSRLPIMDTASARSVPWASSANRLRLENPGERSLTR